MATKRVIAHFMHEDELAIAASSLDRAEVTDSFVLGTIEEDQIAPLRERGIIVQVLGDAVRPAFDVGAGGEVRSLGVPSFDELTIEGQGHGAPAPAGDQEEHYYLASIAGPLLESWRQDIEAAGGTIIERAAGSSYVLHMTGETAADLLNLEFVTGVEPYAHDQTLAHSAPTATVPGRPRRLVTWDLWLHDANARATVEHELIQRNLHVTGSGGRKIRVVIPESAPAIDEVASMDGVARIEEFVPPELHNDVARRLMGVTTDNPGEHLGLDGSGEVIAVADTGLDDSHPDFAGRIVGLQALGRVGDTSDPHGHGTHVAGSAVGSGAASDGEFGGVAPAASLYFQSLLDPSGRLGGLPVSLEELFEPAYAAGARIHNNSWGSATGSRYTIDATEVDAYVASRRDLLVVISAGNEGLAEPRLNTPPGFVDWLSIGSPAACKNALTVGARRSSRTSGGFAELRYSEAWPAHFPMPPIADEKVSGDSEAIAAFSSRGPCDDRRIKPDVVAPGTDILSSRSTKAPLRHFWGAHPNPMYAYMGGTSMSAPLVAGAAALVRQYFANLGHSPSAALLKAALINGTQWLSAPDALADHANVPNYHQGFGSIYLPWSIPSHLEPTMRLGFIDTWQDAAGAQFRQTGQRFRYRFTVAGGERLRVTMAYTDLPARGLQNNLNLLIQAPGGEKYAGNAGLPGSLNIPDPDNNVETVRIDKPVTGEYLVQVSAANLLGAPQDYALVVAGQFDSELEPF